MSLTISELESERSKILDEIENKAQAFSTDSNSTPDNTSLKDWLNAAEEVMPAQNTGNTMRKQANKKSNYASQIMKKPNNSKASFFGVIIMLSLLLTLIGVLYITYTSIHKELQSVLETNQQTVEKMASIQTDMESLQKAIVSGGQIQVFTTLEDKVFALEAQVEALKKQVSNQSESVTAVTAAVKTETPATAAPSATVAKQSSLQNVVTESVLDEKLKSYTAQLEAKIDAKLEAILEAVSQNTKKFDVVESLAKVMPDLKRSMPSIPAPTISEPVMSEVQVPVITQPLVRMVDTVKAPRSPVVQAPIENYTADTKWLMSEPGFNFTLQLASMPDQDSLQAIVEKNQLQDVHIVSQTRKDVTNYVLVSGSFQTRSAADKFARQIKAETNISAWVRKIKDITARIK